MRFHLYTAPMVLAASAAAQSDWFSSIVSEATSIYGEVTSMFASSATADSNSASQTSVSDSNSASQSSAASFASSSSTDSGVSSSSSDTTSASSGQSTGSSTTGSSGSATARPSSTASSTSPTSTASSVAAGAGGTSQSADHSGRNLGIILGCVLGALFLALLILLFICCRRRRRRQYYGSGSSRSSSLNEKGRSGGWWRRRRRRSRRSRSSSLERDYAKAPTWDPHTENVAAIQPHDGFRHGHEHNPFVPVPPPRRKPVPTYANVNNLHSSPIRAVSADQTAHQFSNPQSMHDSRSHGGALAAGAGGLAVGALAASQHKSDYNDNQYPVEDPSYYRRYSKQEHPPYDDKGPATNSVMGAGSLAAAGMASHAAHGRRDSNSPTFLRGTSGRFYAETDQNALPEVVSGPHQPFNHGENANVNGNIVAGTFDPHESTNGSRELTESQNNGFDHHVSLQQRPQDVPAGATVPMGPPMTTTVVVPHGQSNSRSPHRKGILKQTWSDSSNPNSSPNNYEDAVAEQATTTIPRGRDDRPYDRARRATHPAPPSRELIRSPLGSNPPMIATSEPDYHSESSPPPRYHRYSITSSTSPPPAIPPVPADMAARNTRRNSTPSSVQRRSFNMAPNGSIEPSDVVQDVSTQPLIYPSHPVSPPVEPYRDSMADNLISPVSPVTNSQPGTWSQADFANMGLTGSGSQPRSTSRDMAGFHSPSSGDASGSRQSRPSSAMEDLFSETSVIGGQKGIVGDGGYPHHNIPRRMSGGEYDHAETGPLGPQVVGSRTHSLTRQSERGDQGYSSSDDSAFRLGSGIPGAWGDPSVVSRRSGESARYPPRSYNNAPRSVKSRSSSRSSRRSHPASMAGSVKRLNSRPGYGVGSGDPFDLAAMRTDSNTTGISFVSANDHQSSQRWSHPDSASARYSFDGRENPESRYERLNMELNSDVDPEYHAFDVGRAY